MIKLNKLAEKQKVVLTSPRLGKLHMPCWNSSMLHEVDNAKIGSFEPDEFAWQFFMLLARKTAEGEPFGKEEVERLSADDLDDLSSQYLAFMPDGMGEGHENAKHDGVENGRSRLKRVILNFLEQESKLHSGLNSSLDSWSTIKESIFGDSATRKVMEKLLDNSSLSSGLTAQLLKESNFNKNLDSMLLSKPLKESLLGTHKLLEGLSSYSSTLSDFLENTTSLKSDFAKGWAKGYIDDTITHVEPFIIPPDPALKTNALLEELTIKMSGLVANAEHQSEIFSSLAKTANLAFAEAASSSAQAKEATQFTKKGVQIAIVAIVISVVFSLWGVWQEYSSGKSTDHKLEAITAAVDSLSRNEDKNSAVVNERMKGIFDEQKQTNKLLSKRFRQ